MELADRTVCFDKDLEIEAYRFKGIMMKFPNHFHEHYVIGFFDEGHRIMSCKNKEYTIGAGDIIMLNPMDNHSCGPIDEGAVDYRCINIKTEVMKEAIAEITGKQYLPIFKQPVGFQSDLVPLLRELHIAVMEDLQDIRKEEIFLLLIGQLIKEYTSENPQAHTYEMKAEIQEVCSYIDKHYPEHISLNDLGKLAKMNMYSLLRAFTKHIGITPYRYLETVRINEAKKLLEIGIEPINAALQTGFADQSHFTNYFKEFIGLTPKQYQNIFTDDDI